MSEGNQAPELCEVFLSAYRACLIEFGHRGVDACPGLGFDLVQGFRKIVEALGQAPTRKAVDSASTAVRDLLTNWGTRAAQHYERKAAEVKDLLLVMARTTESLGQKNNRFARQLGTLTSQLESIARLDDITRIRASVESSARELKNSVEEMTSESRSVIDHLRAEISTYETKLERAEHIASCDSLTGLGSRHWIEGRILKRIEYGAPFSIVLIDIDAFGRVVEDHGDLVGDLLLKEFAKELRSSCRFTDVVGRWGGDEFIVVIDHCGPEVNTQVARIHSWIAKPYHIPGRTDYMNVHLDVSLGTAEHRPGEHLQELLERADAELCLHRGNRKVGKTA